MPQHSMFPSDPRVTGFSLTVTEVPAESGYAYNVTVQLTFDSHIPRTVYAGRFSGLMVDLLPTLAEDTVSAFMFGEDRDVGRAAVGVQKVARAHSRRHSG